MTKYKPTSIPDVYASEAAGASRHVFSQPGWYRYSWQKRCLIYLLHTENVAAVTRLSCIGYAPPWLGSVGERGVGSEMVTQLDLRPSQEINPYFLPIHPLILLLSMYLGCGDKVS